MSNIKGSRNSIIVPSVSPLISFLFLSFVIFIDNLLIYKSHCRDLGYFFGL